MFGAEALSQIPREQPARHTTGHTDIGFPILAIAVR